jgi:hypothetical protein
MPTLSSWNCDKHQEKRIFSSEIGSNEKMKFWTKRAIKQADNFHLYFITIDCRTAEEKWTTTGLEIRQPQLLALLSFLTWPSMIDILLYILTLIRRYYKMLW